MHPRGLFKQGRGQRLVLQALPAGAAEEHSLNGQGRQAQTIPKRARRQVPGCSSDVRANGARATRLGQIPWRFNLDTLRRGGAKGAGRRSSLPLDWRNARRGSSAKYRTAVEARASAALSSLPFLTYHLGDSGRKQSPPARMIAQRN